MVGFPLDDPDSTVRWPGASGGEHSGSGLPQVPAFLVLPLLLALPLLLTPAPGGLAAQAEWSVVDRMPIERGQTVAVEEGGIIYLLTGSAPGEDATGRLQSFDPGTGIWTDLTPMPDIASHAGAAVLDGEIYVVAGFVANVHAGAMDRVFAYDIQEDTWRSVAPVEVPRGSPGVVALAGRIHAIGGRNDTGLVGAHEIYDPSAARWTSAAPLPLPRDHLGIAVSGGRIHVFGGRTGGGTENTGQHDVYDPSTDDWTSAPPMPTPRSGGASFTLGDLLVHSGGECRPTQPPSTFSEVEAWDPDSGAWTSLPSFPQGRHAFAAVAVERTAYILGGRLGCGGSEPTLEVLSWTAP
jgi:N-acetylneuraminic acid mutarotase